MVNPPIIIKKDEKLLMEAEKMKKILNISESTSSSSSLLLSSSSSSSSFSSSSSSSSTDDNSLPLINTSYIAEGSPVLDPISFIHFLENLNEVPKNSLQASNALTREINPFIGYDYETAKELYLEGMALLLSSKFVSIADAKEALKIVMKRSFKGVSVTSNGSEKDKNVYHCTRPRPETNEDKPISDEAVKQYFGDDMCFSCDHCSWRAKLAQESERSFYFESITPLSSHMPVCFTHNTNNSFKLLKTVSEDGKTRENTSYIKDLLWLNAGVTVTSRSLTRHEQHLKNTKSANAINEYVKIYDELDGSNPELNHETKSILGALHHIKNVDKGFEYYYELSEQNEIDFLAFMTSTQKEDIAMFGDLFFIDSTFSVCNENYKLLNLVLIGNEYNTILGATAFVKHEYVSNYVKLLKFVDQRVPSPKKIPLTLIADCAPQIHSAMSSVHPYAVHIHCAFHLLREKKLFHNWDEVEEKDKEEIRKHAYTVLISSSQNDIKNAIAKLLEFATKYPKLKGRIMYIICHSNNGARPNQRTFSGNSVASSRVESVNSLIKGAGLSSQITFLESILILRKFISDQHNRKSVGREKWLFVGDTEFRSKLDDQGITISNDILGLMYYQFLLACDGEYDVAKKSEIEYIVKYKGNEAKKYNEHSVKLTEKGLFCPCSVKMGYPCRHMFAVTMVTIYKINFRYFDVRFHLNPDKAQIAASNEEAGAYLLKILYDKPDEAMTSSRKIAGILDNNRRGVDVVAAFNEDLRRYNDEMNPQEGAFINNINGPININPQGGPDVNNLQDGGDIDSEVAEIDKEFGGVADDVLNNAIQRFECPEASKSPDLDDERREVANIRSRNGLEYENLSTIEETALNKKDFHIKTKQSNAILIEDELKAYESYDDPELMKVINDLVRDVEECPRESKMEIIKFILTTTSDAKCKEPSAKKVKVDKKDVSNNEGKPAAAAATIVSGGDDDDK